MGKLSELRSGDRNYLATKVREVSSMSHEEQEKLWYETLDLYRMHTDSEGTPKWMDLVSKEDVLYDILSDRAFSNAAGLTRFNRRSLESIKAAAAKIYHDQLIGLMELEPHNNILENVDKARIKS